MKKIRKIKFANDFFVLSFHSELIYRHFVSREKENFVEDLQSVSYVASCWLGIKKVEGKAAKVSETFKIWFDKMHLKSLFDSCW